MICAVILGVAFSQIVPVAHSRSVVYNNNNLPPYYAGINVSATGDDLRQQLTALISKHTQLTYAQLWDAFKTTDQGALHGGDCNKNQMSDVYSAKCWTPGTEQCGNYVKEGSCYNREHSFPKSWWGSAEASPAFSDLFHLFPSDGYDNGKRSNYPLGNINRAQPPLYNTSNDSRLGACVASQGPAGTALPGAQRVPSGTSCWEPSDRVKGEFARAYLYISVAYRDMFTCCSTDATDKAVLKPWLLATVLDWHALHPATASESARHEAVYALQRNRNPFIDAPDFANAIFMQN